MLLPGPWIQGATWVARARPEPLVGLVFGLALGRRVHRRSLAKPTAASLVPRPEDGASACPRAPARPRGNSLRLDGLDACQHSTRGGRTRFAGGGLGGCGAADGFEGQGPGRERRRGKARRRCSGERPALTRTASRSCPKWRRSWLATNSIHSMPFMSPRMAWVRRTPASFAGPSVSSRERRAPHRLELGHERGARAPGPGQDCSRGARAAGPRPRQRRTPGPRRAPAPVALAHARAAAPSPACRASTPP